MRALLVTCLLSLLFVAFSGAASPGAQTRPYGTIGVDGVFLEADVIRFSPAGPATSFHLSFVDVVHGGDVARSVCVESLFLDAVFCELPGYRVELGCGAVDHTLPHEIDATWEVIVRVHKLHATSDGGVACGGTAGMATIAF